MWFNVAILAIVAAAGVKLWNDAKHSASVAATAKIEKQLSDGLLRNEREAADVLRKQVEERDARIAAMTANQKVRATNEKTQRKTNPVYGSWANTPVPQSVVDGLRVQSGAPGGVRTSTSDKQSGTAVQAQSAGTTANNGQRTATALRLGPVRRD